MLTFNIEPIASVWEDRMVCCHDHWQNTVMGKRGEKLNPNLDRYVQYEKANMYYEIVARDEKGNLAGFCGMYLFPSMHTQELLATEDFIYLKHEYRKGRNGYRFYQEVERIMRSLGAEKIMVTAPPETSACRILEKLGCDLSSYGYCKLLK